MEWQKNAKPGAEDLLRGAPDEVVERLRQRSVAVPPWGDLVKEYDPRQHPVMDRALYPDIAHGDGTYERVTRITEDLQRMAVRKTAQLCVGVPVKRVYKPENPAQEEAARLIERIMQANRIDAVNLARCEALFASCEVFTLWYAVPGVHSAYGLQAPAPIKVRCKTYAPLTGDTLYPLMDEYGDLLAISFGSRRRMGGRNLEFFDAYTARAHVRYVEDGGWREILREPIAIGKIPGVYAHRPTPVWEDTSPIVHEIEWALSRNGNYLRRNSKPIFAVFSDDQVQFGASDDGASQHVVQYAQGASASYITWQQAVENLKFYLQELRRAFHTQLQLPDFSFDAMKATPMSGEARQLMFVDAQLKVKAESGRLLEMFDREVNVVKAFAKVLLPGAAAAIDALPVESVVTPFTLRSEREEIANILAATGGKAILSQREGIEYLGWSDDPKATHEAIRREAQESAYGPGVSPGGDSWAGGGPGAG